ncbi:D-alanyl-D-alanine carboxypeptidase/D-alanyl-D-alanine endopeptidase [Edaphobacillus lindanitolerans]|uniref:D-alanyl-D-alanine carboxypeptidase / D-alanyl-D-alanine-endopeptidase (Penicillin-binding protein 4) n=1 Tax=Edaphobacillus lindanitolerans TaxID=550447 RepID=A0A1U7PKY6_9BACI|nr:D-alanyl-D-alanine carboxypeptidase/D-alanyl-D-alanine-endopeptidase [Edaphobacillus lindanitolerans]SIT87171.1 D-alanyl-D-alanine carboxypeptidase / D-alanyl-D-alanine-endopeptidase (penicillin-binding protein 4) [Edaphobacillus lindanitolerans]
MPASPKKWFTALALSALMLVPAGAAESPQIAMATEDHAALGNTLNKILNDPRLAGATFGVNVSKADTGETVYAHTDDLLLHPASNMKILTGIAALDVLGPDYRFSTDVSHDGRLNNGGVLQGNVYLRGKGDPTLLKEDFERFAKDVKSKGVKKIKGDLIADASWYDDILLSEDLNWSDESNYTGAAVSALTASPNTDYDAGTVIVNVDPGKSAGDPAAVTLDPATDAVKIDNRAKTVAKDGRKSITIERAHGTDTIVIEGTIPAGAAASRSWTAVQDPSLYALDLFKKALEAEGISISGKAKKGIVPDGAAGLASKQSMPLRDLYIPFMKLSNNGHAEVLVKEIGRASMDEGSWDAGLNVMSDVLAKYGVDPSAMRLRDGSGMSHKNLVSASQLSTLLHGIQAEPWFPVFLESLPVAGDPDRMTGGTLRNRMTEGPAKGNVQAKTGSLTGVSTLSGYVTGADGEKYIFSILMNNYLAGSVTPIQDDIAEAIAGQ